MQFIRLFRFNGLGVELQLSSVGAGAVVDSAMAAGRLR